MTVTTAPVGIDGDRLLSRLTRLAGAGATAEGGVTRLPWSAEMAEAVGLVTSWGRQAGATVRMDAATNLIAELPGTDPDLPPLVTGSHLDTVIEGGPLDGAYGVVAGIEVLAALCDAGIRLRHPLRVVAYANEEGVVAPSFTGSRAIAGRFDPAELDQRLPGGATLADRLPPDAGGLLAARWTGPVAAVIELHIEQGPVLDRMGVPIGVVTAITGQQRGTITITGASNHAGTTPMGMRRDALVAAAQAVLAIRDLALSGAVDVATAGRIEVSPNAPNVIPGQCRLTFDLRSGDTSRIRAALQALGGRLDRIGADTATAVEIETGPMIAAAATDSHLRSVIGDVATDLGLRHIELVSGAGHDCAHLAALGPIAMIFVPSVAGISHHRAEKTRPADLVDGTSVLLGALLAADQKAPTD